jgi:hypothetical protein
MAHPLVGAWRLVSWEQRTADGQVKRPFDGNATGYIMYHPDGFMSVNIAARQRPPFAANDMYGGTPDETRAAYDTYLGYCGRYDVEGDEVVHHIEVSLFPNWVGVDQRRFIQIEGDTLTIRTPPTVSRGVEHVSQLVWQRA